MRVAAPTSAQRKERIRVASWARERTANPDTIFLDTETTGLGAGADIIDLGVVDLHGNVLIDTLIAPRAPIPPDHTRACALLTASRITICTAQRCA